MYDNEVENIFKYVTRAMRTVGIKISMNRFADKVF